MIVLSTGLFPNAKTQSRRDAKSRKNEDLGELGSFFGFLLALVEFLPLTVG